MNNGNRVNGGNGDIAEKVTRETICKEMLRWLQTVDMQTKDIKVDNIYDFYIASTKMLTVTNTCKFKIKETGNLCGKKIDRRNCDKDYPAACLKHANMLRFPPPAGPITPVKQTKRSGTDTPGLVHNPNEEIDNLSIDAKMTKLMEELSIPSPPIDKLSYLFAHSGTADLPPISHLTMGDLPPSPQKLKR